MRARLPVLFLVMVFAAWFVPLSDTAGARPAPAAVELKPATYRELTRAVRAERGKVVVVDVWGVF